MGGGYQRQISSTSSLEELRARLERLSPVAPSIDPVQAIREERDRR